jgi:hypothetical protein
MGLGGGCALGVLPAFLMYTPLATVFKITPLAPIELAVLFGGGVSSWLTAQLYQSLVRMSRRLT